MACDRIGKIVIKYPDRFFNERVIYGTPKTAGCVLVSLSLCQSMDKLRNESLIFDTQLFCFLFNAL